MFLLRPCLFLYSGVLYCHGNEQWPRKSLNREEGGSGKLSLKGQNFSYTNNQISDNFWVRMFIAVWFVVATFVNTQMSSTRDWVNKWSSFVQWKLLEIVVCWWVIDIPGVHYTVLFCVCFKFPAIKDLLNAEAHMTIFEIFLWYLTVWKKAIIKCFRNFRRSSASRFPPLSSTWEDYTSLPPCSWARPYD